MKKIMNKVTHKANMLAIKAIMPILALHFSIITLLLFAYERGGMMPGLCVDSVKRG